jgi:two-component system chemotaxis response regulator CheY
MMPVEQSLPFLVVDDQRPTLRILAGLPRRLGFPEIDEVIDGALAVAMMREMRGLERQRHVRAEPALGSIPFLMITGKNAIESFVDGHPAGADGCIAEPFRARPREAEVAGAIHAV